MSTDRGVAKSAGVIGGFTSISRVLGFVRDLVIASAFGTGIGAEAFVVSFKIPNLLRDLVGEGAANSAFVPVLTEAREKAKADFWTLVSTLFFIMAAILAVLSVLGIWFAPQVVKLIAPGFTHSLDPDKLPLTIRLTRVIFPYLFLIGLSALAMGVLNSMKEFSSSALGPILLNLSMIVAGIFFERHYGPMALVVGVLVGGVLQLACQIPPLLKSGFRFSKPNFHTPAIRKIGKLLIPRALGSGLYQINIFVDSILASFEKVVGLGGQSALYYSNRLFQLPLAIFGLSLAQALLPTFSSQMVKQDIEGFKKTFSVSVRSLALIVLPASVGLMVLAKPIVRIIFEHGKFDMYSTQITSSALFFYSFGLLSCCFIKILANAFYAMQDTRTPLKTTAYAVLLNIALCLLFMPTLKIGGLALASSISATVNGIFLYTALKKRLGPLDGKRILYSLFKIFLASALMGIVAWAYHAFLLEKIVMRPTLYQVLFLLLGIVLSIGAYFIFTLLLKIEEIKKFLP